MSGRFPSQDFVEPMILKILKNAEIPMSTLAINYHVNENVGRTINLNVIKNNLMSLVNHKKITEKLDKGNGIVYYNLIL